MDFQKEKEAFEKHASKFFTTNEAFEDDGENYVYDEVKFMWDCWLAAKAHEAEKLKGCVLVPVQCPDPDFADSLFDELSKKAIGEFGDDLLIHFSDIDEEKIWALMVEAAKAQAVPECTWVKNEDGYFDASCGQSFVFSEPEDKPSSHEFTHCCFCGGKLIELQEPAND